MTTDVLDPTADSTRPPGSSGRRRFGRHGVRLGLSVLLVIAVGVGAYLLSSSLSSSASPVVAQRGPSGAGGLTPGRFGGPGSGAAGARPTAFGTVASVGSHSFTLTSRASTTLTIRVSTSTTYTGGTGLSAVTVGDRVAVIGTSVSSDEIDASQVLIGVGGRGFAGNGGGNGAGGSPGFGGNPSFGSGGGGNAPSNAL